MSAATADTRSPMSSEGCALYADWRYPSPPDRTTDLVELGRRVAACLAVENDEPPASRLMALTHGRFMLAQFRRRHARR